MFETHPTSDWALFYSLQWSCSFHGHIKYLLAEKCQERQLWKDQRKEGCSACHLLSVGRWLLCVTSGFHNIPSKPQNHHVRVCQAEHQTSFFQYWLSLFSFKHLRQIRNILTQNMEAQIKRTKSAEHWATTQVCDVGATDTCTVSQQDLRPNFCWFLPFLGSGFRSTQSCWNTLCSILFFVCLCVFCWITFVSRHVCL